MPADLYAEVHKEHSVLYTRSFKAAGHLFSVQWRFSDTLNMLDQDFVQLNDATVQALHSAATDAFSGDSALIRRDEIVLGMPQDDGTSFAPVGSKNLRVERIPLRAIIVAHPFSVEGTLHLPPKAEFLHYIHGAHQPFMPITDATVTYDPSPMLRFQAKFLMVNRRAIGLVMDASGLAERDVARRLNLAAAASPASEQPDSATPAMSGALAADLLARVALFMKSDVPGLQEVCTELCYTGRMARRQYPAGKQIFLEGEQGDTLYVVEEGELEVFMTDHKRGVEHRLATLKPNDFFGEMAALGDGKRKASVRALTDVALLSVHESAVKTLLRRFPAATTRMLSILVERQSGLNAAKPS